jgi:hypothetical protein
LQDIAKISVPVWEETDISFESQHYFPGGTYCLFQIISWEDGKNEETVIFAKMTVSWFISSWK